MLLPGFAVADTENDLTPTEDVSVEADEGGSQNDHHYIFMKFDISGVTAGSTIDSATLTLTNTANCGDDSL